MSFSWGRIKNGLFCKDLDFDLVFLFWMLDFLVWFSLGLDGLLVFGLDKWTFLVLLVFLGLDHQGSKAIFLGNAPLMMM